MSNPSQGEYPIIKYTEWKVSCQVKRKLKLFFASIETTHNIYRDTEFGSGRKHSEGLNNKTTQDKKMKEEIIRLQAWNKGGN